MPGNSDIKFGTSGWRAIIGRDFTFANVRLVSRAIAAYLKTVHRSSFIVHRKRSISRTTSGVRRPTVVVGHDTRFMSEDFAFECSRTLAEEGIQPLLTREDTPTPVIAYEIIRRKLAGGINFTASHNPYCYNGIKFSPSYGGPAFPEITNEIEKNINRISTKARNLRHENTKRSGVKIKYIDPKEKYIKRIKELVDLKALRKLKIVCDPLYGTGRTYFSNILRRTTYDVRLIHDWRDVMFGGGRPEPDAETLKELAAKVKAEKADIGIATDGDGDRFGIIDSDGTYINPNAVVTLLVYYLHKTRGWKDAVVRSIATTHMVDAVAKKYGMETIETPVGFKFIAEVMQERDITIGGEESGGLTIRRHVPEKDGILACLLMAEMVANEKRPIKQILAGLYRQVGLFVPGRINLRLTPEMSRNLRNNLIKPFKDIEGIKIIGKNTIDGTKFLLEDGSWVLFRFSGTEPVARVYVESSSAKKLNILLNAGRKMVQ